MKVPFALSCLAISVWLFVCGIVSGQTDNSPYVFFGAFAAIVGIVVLERMVNSLGYGHLLDYGREARRPWRWLLYAILIPIAFSFSLAGYPMDGTLAKTRVKAISKV